MEQNTQMTFNDPNILRWDDVLENDGEEWILLPEGDYTYTVTDFERSQFPGSAKIPPCPKAILTLRVDTEQGPVTVRTDLLMYRTMDWKISAFFRSIGQKQYGVKMSMNWSTVIGSRGRAHFRPREYTTRDGRTHRVNDVERFLDFDPMYFLTTVHPDGLPWENGIEEIR